MRFLAVHPGPLMYTKVFLRLEPLGLELVAASAQEAGHEVRLIDLQAESHADYFRLLRRFRPDALGFSCNYLANVPEIVDLARATKRLYPETYVFVGGHSASFIAGELLEHGRGAIDCILRGEGEANTPALLAAIPSGKAAAGRVPGAVTPDGSGPPPMLVRSLDELRPARSLLRHRRKYFLGVLDPCASIEFTRGCPWDCSFCSAWTFYGRGYRTISTERVLEDLESIREPGVFIVDDVAFIQADQGMKIGEGIARKGIKKQYYLETRGDVLLRNKEVFRLWRKLGLEYMFLGLEAIDAEGLIKHRKRVSLGKNFEALEFARTLGMAVAINLIADPDWDRERFEVVRQWCLETPEIVNISVNTPYPGTETWLTESRRITTRDYRLYDIQHAVLPTKMSLPEFYDELVKTQRILNRKHLGWKALGEVAKMAASRVAHGQTNFVRMLWKFNSVYDPKLLLADHGKAVEYEMALPPPAREKIEPETMYVLPGAHRTGRAIDAETERFVDETRA